MFFNPLFISNASAGNNVDSAKENKFTNSNYLFADIINVSTEKLSSNDGSDIRLESKNETLFKNFEKLSLDAKNKERSTENDYLGDDVTVVEFLTSILAQIEAAKNGSGQLSKADATSFNPEILKTILEGVNSGEKFSIPIENSGKEIFVEIQKFNELMENADTPKIVKLTQSDQNSSTDIDYNQVVSNILSSLKEKFNSDKFNMSEEKISLLISKIETKFSKLVSLNNETFKSQKSILPTLITEVQKELNLSTKESDELKKTIIDEFVKVINSGASTESTKSVAAIEDKQVSVPTLSNKLGLTPKEIKLLEGIELEKLTLSKLDDKLKTLFSDSSQSAEVKSLLSKVETYLKLNTQATTSEDVSSKVTLSEFNNELKNIENLGKANQEIKSVINKIEAVLSSKNNVVSEVKGEEKFSLSDLSQKLNLTSNETKAVQKESSKLEKVEVATTSENKKLTVINHKELNDEANFVKKVKSGIKSVFANKEALNTSSEVEKGKYLVSLKTEKSPESLTLEDDVFAKKSRPELLNKTVYASKESVDLTKLRIVPINENISKENQITQDKDAKLIKVSDGKNGFIETKINKRESSNSGSDMGKKESSQNEQGATTKIASDVEFANDNAKLKPFEKMIIKNAEVESNNAVVKESKTESNILQKATSSELKIEEPQYSKYNVVHNQIFKNDLRVNQKNIYKRINLNNLNQELTHLIQKGGKKIIQFQLTPDNLGKLDIRLEVVDKVISASIKVDNEATQQLVQNSLEGLKTTLNQNGVQYNSLNVSLSNSEDKNQRFFKQKRKNNNTAKMSVEGFDETFTHKNLGYNKYDFIA